MNNLIAFSSSKRIYMCVFLSFICVFAFAQKTTNIKGVKTDNAYANTTEISKSKNATDEQVLAEIEGNYGIGDIVRIVETTPKPTIDPLARRGNGQPASQQPTAPPQYVVNKQSDFDAPSVSKSEPQTPDLPSKTPNIDNPTREMAIPITKIDGTPTEKEPIIKAEIVSNETVKEKSPVEQRERLERKTSSQTDKAERASSRSRVSKNSGFTFKKLSSWFKRSNYKKAKQRKIKNKHKDKCYKF